MSKIAEKKALKAYPKALSPYYDDHILDRNVNCRAGYVKGYDQAMQDFLEKAEGYLRKEFVDMWLRYMRGHSVDDEITMFKNYMQDESN